MRSDHAKQLVIATFNEIKMHLVINLENASDNCPNSLRSEPLQEISSPSAQYFTSWRIVIAIVSLGLSTCLVALDTSVLSVAVPKISTVFSSLDDIAWYCSKYLLTVTVFQPSFGNLYNFSNVNATYLISIVIFEGKMLKIPSFFRCGGKRGFSVS